jgi:hypothetical protein
VILIEIDLGEGKVILDHIQGSMPQHHLKGIGIATIAQVVDGEGVAEAVDVDTGHPGAAANGDQDTKEAGDGNWMPIGICKEGSLATAFLRVER